MTLKDLIRRSGRSLGSAKIRTLLTALAIAVGTFALALTLAASNGATAYVNQIINKNFDPAELIVANDASIFGGGDSSKPREFDPNYTSSLSRAGAQTQIKLISDDDVAKIKQVPGVERIREDITVGLLYITRPDQKKFIGSVQAFSPHKQPDLLAGEIKRPLGDKNILLPEGYLNGLGFSSAADAIGQKVTLAVAQPSQASAPTTSPNPEATALKTEFTVQAVLKKPTASQPGTELYSYIGQDDARQLNDFATKGTANYRKYTYVYARITDGETPASLAKAQSAIKDLGFVTQSVKDTQQFLTSIIGVLQGIVAGFGAIAIIASVFGIVNTMYISVLQRTREIGLMKALGMRKRDIGRLFRFEAAWIGFLGGSIGAGLAFLVGTALNPWITTKLDLGTGNILLIFKLSQLVILIVILMIVSILAGWVPSRKAAKLDPIEALRTE